jgi:hypothetical protein
MNKLRSPFGFRKQQIGDTGDYAGQDLAAILKTGAPRRDVERAYTPFSAKAQMMLRSYSVKMPRTPRR